MSKPVPGKPYTVQNGDTIERIASMAYGDPGRASDITKANQVSTITPGVVLNIPLDFPKIVAPPKTEGLNLFLSGYQVPTESMRLVRSLDAMADTWTATIAWQYGNNPKLDSIIRPYSYADSTVYINSILALTGRLYKTGSSLAGRNEVNLEGWSLAADIIDSTLKPPYESNMHTLAQRVSEIAATFGIKVVSDLDVDGQFDRVTAEETQKAGDHLMKLASQRGVLINSKADGSLRLYKIPVRGKSVGVIEEGVQGFSGFSAEFDGRTRFNTYRFLSQTPGDPSANAVAIDNAVPLTRFTTFKGNDSTTGEVQKAADYRKTKTLADALTIPITAEGFIAPSGDVWAPGQRVTLKSPTLFMPDGFEMMVRSAEMEQTPNGDSTILNLVPPGVYTGVDIVEPWING